jgi:hypothetical protein
MYSIMIARAVIAAERPIHELRIFTDTWAAAVREERERE